MKIGWIVEGSTDKAFLYGLKKRWCPEAELIELGFRGSKLRPRNYPKSCAQARHDNCNFVVILTDSNNSDLNTVYKNERQYLKAEHKHFTVIGVAVRNIECWICADADYIASKYHGDPNDLRSGDPKRVFQKMLAITTFDKKENEIEELVCQHPNFKPLLSLASFSRFYTDICNLAKQNGCYIPNEYDN